MNIEICDDNVGCLNKIEKLLQAYQETYALSISKLESEEKNL